ncbi:MAG: hypothetical protein M1817_002738 [Caeruleum heppii]|nr:MAG: hypothetical protein M1817_002738 [Caeruleum heppii]
MSAMRRNARFRTPNTFPTVLRHVARPAQRPCIFRRSTGIAMSRMHSYASAARPDSDAPRTLPRVVQPKFWTSLVPSFLRRTSRQLDSKSSVPKEWNPATFFIIIFLLIGSQAIQMIGLRSQFNAFGRRADAKIALLKEVIERVQKGEDVDVEGLLGTGDKAKEKEWEEVLKEIEEEDALWQSRSKRRPADVENPDPKGVDGGDNPLTSKAKTALNAPSTPHTPQPETKTATELGRGSSGFY